MEALELEALRSRLSAVAESSKRSRLAFIFSIIASLAVLIGLYNSYLSWYKGFALKDSFATNEVTRKAQEVLLEEWIKNQTIAVQILGIRVGTSDAAILSSVALFIITLWLFFCIRRENHITGMLLADTEKMVLPIREFVFQGVTSQMLFLDATGSDEPILSLEPVTPKERTGFSFVRFSIDILYFLPTVTVAACMIFDALTIFQMPAPFRWPHLPLYNVIGLSDLPWIIVVEGIALILGTLTAVMIFWVLKFEKATQRLIRQYHSLLHVVSVETS